MPSRVAVGPAQGRAVAAGAGLQRCDRGLPWARRLLAAVRLPAYCYCDMRGFLLLYRSLRLYI